MVIAVNTRFLLKDLLEGYGYFTQECFRRIVNDHPTHQFIFIFDRPFDPSFVFAPNVTPVVTGPPARHPLLWKYWYDVKLPAVLRKYKADVFVSNDGFCSLSTRVPQCLVVHDLAFLHFPDFIHRSHLRYYRRNTPRFLKKAASIATVSAFSKNDIMKNYPAIAGDKITVVGSSPRELFGPTSVSDQQAVRDRYSDGKEFFLYTGSIHPRKNLMNLLKAFSIFKKRQKSSMKLLLCGRLAWKYESFRRDLAAYKFREDVLLTGYIPETELAAITAAAYAMIYPSFFEGFGVPVLEAMRSGVAVVTSEGSAMEEVAGPAALYANPSSPESIADQMMLLYKDEKLRKRLSEEGRIKSDEYSWDRTANLLWQAIEKAI